VPLDDPRRRPGRRPGGFLARELGIGDPSGFLGAIVVAFVGAVIVRFLLEAISRPST
jgi:uncharacterized membrane protein YeaQ/YmgE (transglycosylase-associated protein family)